MLMKSYSRIIAIFRREIVENFLVSDRNKIFSPPSLESKFFKRVLSDAVLSKLSFGSLKTGLASQKIFQKIHLKVFFAKFSLFHEISTRKSDFERSV